MKSYEVCLVQCLEAALSRRWRSLRGRPKACGPLTTMQWYADFFTCLKIPEKTQARKASAFHPAFKPLQNWSAPVDPVVIFWPLQYPWHWTMCSWCFSFLYVVSSASCRFDKHFILGLNNTIQQTMYYNFMPAYILLSVSFQVQMIRARCQRRCLAGLLQHKSKMLPRKLHLGRKYSFLWQSP